MKNGMPALVRGSFAGLLCLVLLSHIPAVWAKYFPMQGREVWLQEVTGDVAVQFRALRYNRASGAWNLDLVLTNQTSRSWTGAWVVLVKEYSGTTGPRNADDNLTRETGQPFYDLSAQVPGQTLAPGQNSSARTVVLGFLTNQAPRLDVQVFVTPQADWQPSLVLVRTLDEIGFPLPGVSVTEQGPMETRSLVSDSVAGVVTLGQDSGEHLWVFTASGRLPVWRKQVLASGMNNWIPNPRLPMRTTNSVQLKPGNPAQIASGDGSIRLIAGPTTVSTAAKATLTPLTGQTLPGLLPSGWSPLQAFCLEVQAEGTNQSLSSPIATQLSLWDALSRNETAVWIRWDESQVRWRVVDILSGGGTNAISASIVEPGTFALAVGDEGRYAPPPPQKGRLLEAGPATALDWNRIAAFGTVDPATSRASKMAEWVTAEAKVVITNAAGAIPSGLVLPGRVHEYYQLNNGGRRQPPQYDVSLTAYRRPSRGFANTLEAQLSLRPLLLFGEEELAEATVSLDVLSPQAFQGGILGTNESAYRQGDFTLSTKPGDLSRPQAMLLRTLDLTDFQELAVGGQSLVAGFELTAGGLAPGRKFGFSSSSQTDGYYMLGRIVLQGGLYGLAPVERLQLTNHSWVSLETGTGARLPGIDAAGQYFLVRVSTPQALVQGVGRDGGGHAASGLPVTVAGQPWAVVSGTGGVFQITAPAGDAQLLIQDPKTGFAGGGIVPIGDLRTIYYADLTAKPSGPQVSAMTPAPGAVNVPRVSSIAIAFSQPVNPGSLGTNGIVLLNANLESVGASVTLNLKNTKATVLPLAQLAANTLFTVRISTNLTGTNGLRLAGPDVFTFTTERSELNRLAAQVISHEPTNGLARMVGTPGTAEPESPVILVNESSGQTATVLSKVDGSFDNVIDASVDDFLSAVLVNKNGTRNSIAVSKQVFRDGSIGLFNGGGILEAQSDGGPVQILIEPGSIETKTKFSLVATPLAEILQLLAGLEPDGGKLLGGFKIKTEGDPLKTPAKLKFPLNPSSVTVPPGKALSDGGFALAAPSEFDGVKVFEFADDLHYQSGMLQSVSATDSTNVAQAATASFLTGPSKSATLGLANAAGVRKALGSRTQSSPTQANGYDQFVAIAMGFAGKITVSGQFLSWDLNHADEKPVPNATVYVNPTYIGGLPNRKLPPGALVTTTKKDGTFSLTTYPPSGVVFEGESYYMFGLSILFPGKIGTGTANPTGQLGPFISPFARGKLHIERTSSAAQPDFLPPEIFVTHSPADPLVNDEISLQVLATDNLSVTRVEATRVMGTGTFSSDGNSQTEGQSVRRYYRVKSPSRQTLQFRIKAVDGSGNSKEILYAIEVGKTRIPPLDPEDQTGPWVICCAPANASQNVDRFKPLRIGFNERLDPSNPANFAAAVQLSPFIATPAPAPGTPRIEISQNHRELFLTYFDLRGDTVYSLNVGNQITDANGKTLDQYPKDGAQVSAYSCGFKTWKDRVQNLSTMNNGAGVAGTGPYFFALDKASRTHSALKIYLKSDTGADLVTSIDDLPEYGRHIVFIPNYSYYDASLQKRQKDFVAVVGGENGAETSRQWLWLIDVTNPGQPIAAVKTHIIRSPTAIVAKLAWSPPLLGYLEYDSESIGGIGLIDLQLLLYSRGLANYNNEPMTGQAGIDANGDGDYTDDLETLPRPAKRLLRDGVFNGGLVGGYSLGDAFDGVINDFELAFNGKFAAVVHGRDSNSSIKPACRILAVNGQALDITEGYYEFPQAPSRLSLLFGATVGLDNPRILNLALVSGGKPGMITVLNIMDPRHPVLLSEFAAPSDMGAPMQALYVPASSGGPARVFISGTQSVLVMDPLFLDWSSNTGAAHPGFVGDHPECRQQLARHLFRRDQHLCGQPRGESAGDPLRAAAGTMPDALRLRRKRYRYYRARGQRAEANTEVGLSDQRGDNQWSAQSGGTGACDV
jgi:hypothetical protein